MKPVDQLRDDLAQRLTSHADGKPVLRCEDAFDLAGTGKANPASLLAALKLAQRLAAADAAYAAK